MSALGPQEIRTAYRNLPQLFARSADRGGDGPFLWARQDGIYRSWSWKRVDRESRAVAAWLQEQGMKRGDRVVLVSENRPEWCIADLAIMRAGGITVPAYTTNTARDHAYILGHSEAAAAICSTRSLQRPLFEAICETPGLRSVLVMDPPEKAPANVACAVWHDLTEGSGEPSLVDHIETLGPDDTACFIYTSGTGGRPKGVMLSHGNILANVAGAAALLEEVGLGEEVFLSFLPLSHAYEHTAGLFLPMAISAQIYYAGSVESLARDLLEARPTIVTCVPRLFEVLRQRISRQVERSGGLRARLFAEAQRLGAARYRGAPMSLRERWMDRLLDRLVRRKIQERFGGRLKALVSGGAALNYEVGLFFVAFGLPLLQGYGQTEASPVISCNPPHRCRIETVGPPLPGVEVRLAEDGEILVRGDNVMKGYWKDEIATAQALRDGWLHTGDVGAIDADGYLRITDRKKDIIVTSGGDNVSPQRVEGVLTLEPEIAQAVVYGDGKPFLVALIVPDPEFMRSFAVRHGLPAGEDRISELPAFRMALREAVDRANRQLGPLERIKQVDILEQPFTIEEGLLTPTLKVRRHLVYRKYRERFEALYERRGRAAAS